MNLELEIVIEWAAFNILFSSVVLVFFIWGIRGKEIPDIYKFCAALMICTVFVELVSTKAVEQYVQLTYYANGAEGLFKYPLDAYPILRSLVTNVFVSVNLVVIGVYLFIGLKSKNRCEKQYKERA